MEAAQAPVATVEGGAGCGGPTVAPLLPVKLSGHGGPPRGQDIPKEGGAASPSRTPRPPRTLRTEPEPLPTVPLENQASKRNLIASGTPEEDLVLRFINTATYPCVVPGAKGRSGGFLGAWAGTLLIHLRDAGEEGPPAPSTPPPCPGSSGRRHPRNGARRGRSSRGRGIREKLSGREVKRRLAGASQVERRSEEPPPRMRSDSRPRAPGPGRGNPLGQWPDTIPYLR